MIKKKDLLKRIQSLEQVLGLAYTHEEYPEHVAKSWGTLKRIEDLFEKQDREERVNRIKETANSI